MCMGSPKVSTPPPAPTPAPIASPAGDDLAPTVKTSIDKESEDEKAKRVKRRGTKSLQTGSGLNIPTSGSGLNIS